MGRAKEIIVKVIPAKIANDFIYKYHYSGKVAATGLICFGAFLDNKLIGVAQWGRPINKYLHLHVVVVGVRCHHRGRIHCSLLFPLVNFHH